MVVTDLFAHGKLHDGVKLPLGCVSKTFGAPPAQKL